MCVEFYKPKVIILQCFMRQYLAKKKLFEIKQALLQEYQTFMNEYDFYSSNEYQNWKWFGMIKEEDFKDVSSDTTSAEAEATKKSLRHPCVSLIEMKLPSSFPSNDFRKASASPLTEEGLLNIEKQVLTDYSPIQSIQDNEFVSILEMIPFPDIPPNCLYPVNGNNEKKVLLSYNPSLLLYEEEEKLRRKHEMAANKDKDHESAEISHDESTDVAEETNISGINEIKEENALTDETNNDLIISHDTSLETIKLQNETILKNLITKNRILSLNKESLAANDDELLYGYNLLDYSDLSKDMKNGLNDILVKKNSEVMDIDSMVPDTVIEDLSHQEKESFFANLSRKFFP
jgi:hypothetical protein